MTDLWCFGVWFVRGLVAVLIGCWVAPASGQPAVKNDTAKVSIKKLMPPLNTPFNDFAPVISADGATMMFTSNRPSIEREMAKGKAGRENIYEVTVDPKKKKWGIPKLLGPSVNAVGRNNSAIALSPDGQRMLVYRDNNDGNGNIFESVLNGTEWSELVEFPEPINSEEHESSGCYSPDGRTIYFVSDNPANQTLPGRYVQFCCDDLSRQEVDGNRDGVINALDRGYIQVILTVWDDANQDCFFGPPTNAGFPP